jgi:chromatin remodeling complex protein RSC6
MPAKKSSTKTATETEQVATPVITTPVVETAPVAEKAPKAKKAKAPKTEEAVAPVVASVPAPVEPEAPAHVDVEAVIAEQSADFHTKLNQLGNMIASLKSEYRSLEKKWSKELKASQKLNTKKKRKAGNRAPSGFVKPTRISDELASFLGKEKGTQMARTEVTREINTYIRSNTLQDKENGRKINPDSKLAGLLKLKKTDELTYFNLQKYMSPHFAKASKDAVVA